MEEPDPELNRQILERRSKENMRKHSFRKSAVAAAVACVAVTGSITAYAAYHYLNPSQIAEELSNDKLAKAFESKDAVKVNETQTIGNHKVTLLGTVSGAGLSSFVPDEISGKLQQDDTYAALAIERTDGKIMREEQKTVSPLIHGVDWTVANNGTLDAGLQSFVQDGVLYELYECDNLEIFAGRGVQIGVVDRFGEENHAFTMDEQTGVYERADGYKGMNALFDLPLDTSNADEKAAEQYIRELQEKAESGSEDVRNDAEQTPTGDMTEAEKEYQEYETLFYKREDDVKFLREHAEVIPGSKQILTVDQDGYVSYTCQDGSSVTKEYVGDQEIGKTYIAEFFGDGTLEGSQIVLLTKNEDGTVTCEEYRPVGK